VKLSAAMAIAFSPSESRERGMERVDGRWASAGWHGIHDDVDDLTSGANASVRSPNGSQVLRLVGHDGKDDVHSELASLV
jgi:hypothetical protein